MKGEPHTVEIVPSLRGIVTLVGYDAVGEVMVEFRVPAKRYHPRMADKLRRWVREQDDTTPLRVVR